MPKCKCEQKLENENIIEKQIEFDSTFHTAFQTKWEGPYRVEKKYENGIYQLMDLDGKRPRKRVNGIQLKKCFAQLMVALKEEDHEDDGLWKESVMSDVEEHLDISPLFVPLLDTNVLAEERGC